MVFRFDSFSLAFSLSFSCPLIFFRSAILSFSTRPSTTARPVARVVARASFKDGEQVS